MKHRTNGELRGTPHVQVVDEHDAPLGHMALSKALRVALAKGLDLVELDATTEPPSCKLVRRADSRRSGRDEKPSSPAPPTGPKEESEVVLPPATTAAWLPFECDGRALEYLAVPTRTKSRPADWPAHEPFPGQWVPVVLVAVREREREGDRAACANGASAPSVGLLLREGTVVTVAHAIEAARMSART
jgi:hypothetical protein